MPPQVLTLTVYYSYTTTLPRLHCSTNSYLALSLPLPSHFPTATLPLIYGRLHATVTTAPGRTSLTFPIPLLVSLPLLFFPFPCYFPFPFPISHLISLLHARPAVESLLSLLPLKYLHTDHSAIHSTSTLQTLYIINSHPPHCNSLQFTLVYLHFIELPPRTFLTSPCTYQYHHK